MELMKRAIFFNFILLGVIWGTEADIESPDIEEGQGSTMSGQVVDVDGVPQAGLKLQLYWTQGDESDTESIVTDEQGYWVSTERPQNPGYLNLSCNSPGVFGQKETIIQSELDEFYSGQAVLYICPGIQGRVVDPNGEPVSGCQVSCGPSHVTTQQDGSFSLEGKFFSEVYINIQAEGYPQMGHRVELTPDTGYQQVQLKPWSIARVVITDPAGNVLEGVEVNHVARYQDHTDIHKITASNSNGQVVLKSANNDTQSYMVSKPGYISLESVAFEPSGNVEKQIVMFPCLNVSGRVEDAWTGLPINNYSITVHTNTPPKPIIEQKVCHESDFNCVIDYLNSFYRDDIGLTDFWLEVQAEGYDPVVSQTWPIGTTEAVCIIQLSSSFGVMGRVYTPQGLPAAGAIIESYTRNVNTEYDTKVVAVSAEDGSFSLTELPVKGALFHLTATHEFGYGQIAWDQDQPSPVISLQRWARLEGSIKVGNRTWEDTNISVRKNLRGREDIPFDRAQKTDADGNFLFEQLPPGSYEIDYCGRGEPILLDAGDNRQITLGQTGTSVRGRVVLPDYFTDPNCPVGSPDQWRFTILSATKRTENGSYTHLLLHPSEDGSFIIQDIDPGEYRFQMTFKDSNDKKEIESQPFIMIPRATDPNGWVNLGNIPMKTNDAVFPGQMAPDFEVQCMDGSVFRLSEHRGKVILLHFWYGHIPAWPREVFDPARVYMDHPGFVPLGLAVGKPDQVREVIQDETLFWQQAHITSNFTEGISYESSPEYVWFVEHYGIPIYFQWCVIGPDGRVISTFNLADSTIAAEVSRALEALDKKE